MEPEVAAAARSREEARTRARRLTWWAAAAAAAVTGIGAGLAVASIPGHAVDQTQAAAPPAESGGSGDTGGGFNPPAQAPQFGGSTPVIVSGGS
ncbi:MAG TPA: hypothetical protein VF155_07945 [Candidatus Dormibacteraeota bacterium]